jgi:UDP-N-acetyl-D-glucosamine dehydrogenase
MTHEWYHWPMVNELGESRVKVVVVGQGYVGLPLAMQAARCGYDVVGLDLNELRVTSLQQGISFVEDVSDADIADRISSGAYSASSDYSLASGFDVAVITVPTPLQDGLPNLSFIESAARSLAPLISPGSLVVLESTTYPGTTEELMVPLLESGSGMVAGTDFYVGYSPERIDPGNKTWTFYNTPKVVSGIGAASLERVTDFYSSIVQTIVPVSGTREAELTKLLENTFRHVNIALINELAVFSHQLGVDIWEAISAAATKPFGFMKFTPGPGVGGHCLPVDPSYLSWQVKRQVGQNFRFVELANDVNSSMPRYVVQRASTMLNSISKSVKGSHIALVGLSYKKNTADVRESPSMEISRLLVELGANVTGIDPFVEDRDWPDHVMRALSLEEVGDSTDLVIILTDHDGIQLDGLASSSKPVLDTRNAVRGPLVEIL